MERKRKRTGNLVFVRVGEHQILSNRSDIGSIPVQVILHVQGREVYRQTGFLPKYKCPNNWC
jgi:hypothetical protein